MKRVLKWFLVVVGLSVAVSFWPGSPASLSRFDPERMAELQVSVWKNSHPPRRSELFHAFYGIFSQYRMRSPLLAVHSAEAVILFQSAPDAADQAKALAPLVKVFSSLQARTKSAFDPHAVAQMELQIWGLRANGGRQAELATALAEQLALLYGRPVEPFLPVAKKFALAMQAADKGQWAEALSRNKAAWIALKALVK